MAFAASAAPTGESDAVYTALSDADYERADKLTADWLARSEHSVAGETQALQTRIELLSERHRLDAEPGAQLAAAIDEFAKRHVQGQSLQRMLLLYRSMENLKVAAIEAGESADADFAAEARGAEPQRAYSAHDLKRVLASAPAAIAAWHARHGLHARWHEYELETLLAHAESRLGQFDDAAAAYARAAAVAEAAFGPDSAIRLDADTSRAEALETVGHLREGQDLREAVLERARRRFGPQHLQTAEAEQGLASCLQIMGDYAASRKHFEAAESILATLPKVPASVRAMTANNFANVLEDVGDMDAAIAHYHTAIAAMGEIPAAQHNKAIALSNLGAAEAVMERYEQSSVDYQTAIALCEHNDGENSPCAAQARDGLGVNELALHRYPEAEGAFRQGFSIYSQSLPADHPKLTVLRFELALARWGQADLAGAFDLAQQAAEHAQALLEHVAANYTERQGLALRDQLPPASALAVTLAAKQHDAAKIAEAWRLTMNERGLLARAEARRLATARLIHDPAFAKLFAAWRDASSDLAQAWLSNDVRDDELAQLRDVVERSERAVWTQAHNRPLPAIATPSLAELARALPADATLLAVARALPDDPAWALPGRHDREANQWYAFTLARSAEPQLVKLGRVAAIAEQARAWHADLQDPHSAPADLARHGSSLRATLLDQPHVAHKGLLFFVPDGELYRLNLAALPLDKGYALEAGLRVHTLDAESDLLGAASPTSPSHVLLAGAPTFAHVSNPTARHLCPNDWTGGLTDLPEAARELSELQRLFAGLKAPVQLFAGDAATKSQVTGAVPGASVVHLATHGFSFASDCSLPGETARAIQLRQPDDDNLDTGAMSGLAFAGEQNARGGSLLSAGEIAGIDLSRAEWVALSACDTGLGPIDASEGVFGLRRALRLAGARTVVMSLWQADDAATADLMLALYRAHFVDHDAVPTAAAKAMRSVLDSRRANGLSDHPYYWAAFVSAGAWH